MPDIQQLRILIASEDTQRLELLAEMIIGLGHEVAARVIDTKAVGAATARERPDVALVWLGLSSTHALDLIDEIVQEATCPVIALLSTDEPAYVSEAARRGIFAYIVDTTPDELQAVLEITLERFTEYHRLQGAFGRRVVIEQAKGILMGRHAIDADEAFRILRDQSQRTGQKLADLASALVNSHRLLHPPEDSPDSGRREGQ